MENVINRKKGIVIINANQKGGVGKTTSTILQAVVATLPNDQLNNKGCVIDWEGQGNCTSTLGKTFNIESFPKSVYQCIDDNDLMSGIVNLTDNLDMIAGAKDIKKYPDLLEDLYPKTVKDYKKKRTFHFKELLEQIRYLYDYIWIDVGPSADIKVDNAMVCADYVIIIQETKTYSLEGSVDIVYNYLDTLHEDFPNELNLEVPGILFFLKQSKHDLHEDIMDQTNREFGKEFSFSSIVTNSLRIESYPEYGITVIDYYDRRVFALFADIFAEFEERVNMISNDMNIPLDYSYKPKYLNGNKLTKLSRELNLKDYENYES